MQTAFKNVRVLVCGGDGFCGWPLTLRLANMGADCIVVDNLSRRGIDNALGFQSLVPIASLEARVATWNRLVDEKATDSDVESPGKIQWRNIDIAKSAADFNTLVATFQPSVIFHLAEQRSAPHSMRSQQTREYTVTNNINTTHNILSAIVQQDRDIRLVHLGTMGVYGYGVIPDMKLKEGYVDVSIDDKYGKAKSVSIPYPGNPGSIYHMTKTLDAEMFRFYQKNWGLNITDLHQGIIWGIGTKETALDAGLANRLDYDGDYGTVLNRFIMQAATGHPMTVNGTGGQTRAFIHIENAVECMCLAMKCALAAPGSPVDRVSIFNQMTQTLNVMDLAKLVKDAIGGEIKTVDNPRKELVKNDLAVCNDRFLALGLKPINVDKHQIAIIGDKMRLHSKSALLETINSVPRW